jgi:pimeloyl-ACP methyl ester carboxylesterase
MKLLRMLLASAALLAATTLLAAQKSYAPPPSKPPDEATTKAIAARTEQLDRALKVLRRQGVHDPGLADVEIYHKAATWIVQHNEFYQAEAGQWTLEALDRGLLRASQLARGETPWLHLGGYSAVRAYRSRVDGSVQPYAVTFPEDYGENQRKKWRVDVVLHGRDPSLTEVKFLHQHNGDQAAPKDQDFVQLDIFGRGNNAYRWAGETDVLEAIDAFVATEGMLGRARLLDPERIVLRGFSMGGAGTWHLGLHRPSRWCVLGPGAGFTATHGYVHDLPAQLPPYQEACLHIYDAVDYAENAFDVPIVAYGGDKDPQLQAARNIAERLKPLTIPMTLLVAPGLGHTFPPEWRAKAEAAYAKHTAKGREEYPERVRFVTYTLRYPTCAWVELIGLNRHYERARVDAQKTDKGFTIQTENVRALRLGLPPSGAPEDLVVHIDGQELNTRAWISQAGAVNLYLERREGRWHPVLPQRLVIDQVRRLQKAQELQGPIDDAFMGSFLCVRGTGKPWHEATQKYAEANLKRFEEEWSKYLRGSLPVKDDVEITDEDIATKHLILFGDPASNPLIAQVLDRLPLKWDKEHIALAGTEVSAAEHVPVLIYPSPLMTGRYVVLNSGHTFHAAEFEKTNALLYPRLGDYAILKLAATEKDPLAVEVTAAGLFNDWWQTERK